MLRQAVAKELERKRRLGQYAVIWRDGQVQRLDPDGSVTPLHTEDRAPAATLTTRP